MTTPDEHQPVDDCVPPRSACPLCGQDEVDRLVWIDDERVECQTCKTIYNPNWENANHETP